MNSTLASVSVVRGPDGIPMCLNDLPAGNTTRWIKRKKQMVAAAIKGGLLSFEAAAENYRLSAEELQTWMDQIANNARAGQTVHRRSY